MDGVLFCDRQYWYSRPGPGEEDFPFPAPFDTGFYLIMNVAVGGGFTGGPIDEVRVGVVQVACILTGVISSAACGIGFSLVRKGRCCLW